MELTVEQFFQAIQRCELVEAKDLETIRARWFDAKRKERNDAGKFSQWLVTNRYLTPFMVQAVSKDQADLLVLKPYKIKERLAVGPMKGSLLAGNEKHGTVALDVIAPGFLKNPAQAAAISRVAQKLTAVKHVNVGRVIELGEARGLHYLAREFQEGETLASILQRRGKLPFLPAARLFTAALAGLQALHDDGVPGGDLTPDCLLLTKAGTGGTSQRTVKILYAGLSRRLFDNVSVTDNSQASDDLSGFLLISAAPSDKVQPEVDIFRLGCVFYQCLAGEPPYSAADLPEPRRPAKALAACCPDVPDMLAQLVEKMIDPVPAQRPMRTAYLAKSLRVFLASEEIESPEARPEDYIAGPALVAKIESETEDATAQEQPVAKPQRRQINAQDKIGVAASLWAEIAPDERDFLFLIIGVVLFITFVLVLRVVSGFEFKDIVFLFAGSAIGLLFELIHRWRAGRQS